MNALDIKVYCVNFSVLGVAGVNVAAFTRYLYDSIDIIAFWNYLPGVFCLKSRLTATELAAKLLPFFPDGNFMVAEINVYNMNGSLPREAWEWFYLPHHQKSHPPAFPSGLSGYPGLGLAGLLGAPPKPPGSF